MYKTAYQLSIVNEPYSHYINHYVGELKFMFPVVEDILHANGSTAGLVTWTNYDDCIKEISVRHSKVIFMITGHGQEYTDIWAKYYLNGKSYSLPGRLQFDHFNEELLK